MNVADPTKEDGLWDAVDYQLQIVDELHLKRMFVPTVSPISFMCR